MVQVVSCVREVLAVRGKRFRELLSGKTHRKFPKKRIVNVEDEMEYMKKRLRIIAICVFGAIAVAILIIGLICGRNKNLSLSTDAVKLAIRNGNTGEVTIITERKQLEKIITEINELELTRIGRERRDSSGWSCIIDLYYSDDEKPSYSLNLKGDRIVMGRNIYGEDERVRELQERLLKIGNGE